MAWPHALPLRLALAAALALTALLLAHLIAFTRWYGPRVRQCMAAREARQPVDLERRRLLRAALRMGVGAVSI